MSGDPLVDPFIFKDHDWKLPGWGQSLLICGLTGGPSKKLTISLKNCLFDLFFSYIFSFSINLTSGDIHIKQERD